MNRREALKQMGTVAIGAGLGIGGLHAAEVLDNPAGEYQGRKMNVLLVNGSPNKEGCTYTALTEVGKGLKEQNVDSEVFWIGRRPISGCVACGACSKTGRCYMNDAVNEFLDKAEDMTALSLAHPCILLRWQATSLRLWTGRFSAPVPIMKWLASLRLPSPVADGRAALPHSTS